MEPFPTLKLHYTLESKLVSPEVKNRAQAKCSAKFNAKNHYQFYQKYG